MPDGGTGYIGDVRNSTNHAIEEFSGFCEIKADTDISERMKLITQALLLRRYMNKSGLFNGTAPTAG
jgi:hypothetical protein